ncbi:MAG: hypothetical protein MI754_19360, partial [Chromatiales bacterium]|nr:hypothetical protein [Chromatiales bacterium]
HFQRSPDSDQHLPGFRYSHGIEARATSADCGRCHNPGFCVDCHAQIRPCGADMNLLFRYVAAVTVGVLLVVPGSSLAVDLILTPEHGGGSAWELSECAACHPINFIHRKVPDIRDIVQRKGYESCSGCHGDNGTGEQRQCRICHNSDDLPTSPHLDGFNRHAFIGIEGDQECVTCHQASDMDGVFELNRDLTQFAAPVGHTQRYFNTSEFCLRCHNRDHQIPGFEIEGKDFRDPLIAMEDNYNRVDFHGRRPGHTGRTYSGLRADYRYPDVVECTDCHDMHATDNPALLIDRQQKGASRLFENRSGGDRSIEIFEGEFAQLCVICHRMEANIEEAMLDTGNGLSGVHQSSGDCLACHRHGLGAQSGL